MGANASSSNEARLNLMQRILSYGPLAVTAGILIVQTFIPDWLDLLPLSATLAILAGSVIFLVWHVEGSLVKSENTISALQNRINELESTQAAFIQSTTVLNQLPCQLVLGFEHSLPRSTQHV